MIGVSVVSMLLKIDPIPCGLLMGLVEQIHLQCMRDMKAERVGVRTMERRKRVIAAAKTLESLQR